MFIRHCLSISLSPISLSLKLIGWYADENLGGIPGTIKSMLKADPEFILGICLNLTLDLMFGIRSLKTDSTVNDDLRTLERVASTNPNVTKRELKHIDAVTKYAKDEVDKAYLAWESILFGKPQRSPLTSPRFKLDFS